MGLYNKGMALFFLIELIIFIIALKFKNKKVFIIFIIVLISFLYAKTIENIYEKAFIYDEDYYIAKIESLKEEVKYYNRYVARIKIGKYKNYKIYIYTKEDLSYGDVIKFSEKIEHPECARNDKRI